MNLSPGRPTFPSLSLRSPNRLVTICPGPVQRTWSYERDSPITITVPGRSCLLKNSVLIGIVGALVTLNPIRIIADVPKLKDSTHPSSLTDTMAPLTKKDSSQQYLLSRGSIRMHREDHSSSVSSIQIQARMIFYFSRMCAYPADVSSVSPAKSSNQSVHNAGPGPRTS